MNAAMVTQLIMEMFILAAKLATPPLIAALASGLCISLFQAVTQINDSTLSFFPKVIAVAIAIYLCAPWMCSEATTFTANMFHMLETATR